MVFAVFFWRRINNIVYLQQQVNKTKKYMSTIDLTNPIAPLYDPEYRAYLNEESMQAIEESMNGSFAGEVDTTDIESFKKSFER